MKKQEKNNQPPNLYKRNYVVTLKYGTLTSAYIFIDKTKNEIIKFLFEAKIGESLSNIDFTEINENPNGVFFIPVLQKEDNYCD